MESCVGGWDGDVSRWVGLAGGDHECGEWAGQGVEQI